MAKGFGSRGMGGGINMNMIKQAQKMQQDMQRMQAELEQKEYTAQAGGGVVSATVTGRASALPRRPEGLAASAPRAPHDASTSASYCFASSAALALGYSGSLTLAR